jgi:hypothetical protein
MPPFHAEISRRLMPLHAAIHAQSTDQRACAPRTRRTAEVCTVRTFNAQQITPRRSRTRRNSLGSARGIRSRKRSAGRRLARAADTQLTRPQAGAEPDTPTRGALGLARQGETGARSRALAQLSEARCGCGSWRARQARLLLASVHHELSRHSMSAASADPAPADPAPADPAPADPAPADPEPRSA